MAFSSVDYADDINGLPVWIKSPDYVCDVCLFKFDLFRDMVSLTAKFGTGFVRGLPE